MTTVPLPPGQRYRTATGLADEFAAVEPRLRSYLSRISWLAPSLTTTSDRNPVKLQWRVAQR